MNDAQDDVSRCNEVAPGLGRFGRERGDDVIVEQATEVCNGLGLEVWCWSGRQGSKDDEGR